MQYAHPDNGVMARYDHAMGPEIARILETALYVGDLARSAAFYEKVFGFRTMTNFAPRGCALSAGEREVLLLFTRDGSRTGETPHYGNGELHLAFAIRAEDLNAWETWLASNDIAIEEKKLWDRGGTSLYFRDPDRHLIEVATPGVWPNY